MINYNDDIEFLKKMMKTSGGQEAIIEHIFSSFGLPEVHTPFDLCLDILGKLNEYTSLIDNKKIAVLFNIEFVHTLVNAFGVNVENICMFTDNKVKYTLCQMMYKMKPGVNLFMLNVAKTIETAILHIDAGRFDMKPQVKYDIIVMNPPYQTKSDDSHTKTQSIWEKFVKVAVEDLTVENGSVCAVHPSGWRSNSGICKEAQVLKTRQIEYLEIHSKPDGQKTFGATTRYDWYVAKNCPISHNTNVKDQFGVNSSVDLRKLPFIPNAMIDKIVAMMAKEGEEKVEILHSFSAYESRKPFMSETQHDDFIYPVVYSTPMVGPTIWYSSKKNGHFGIPKLILNPCNPLAFVIDETGKYGMSQFCNGIVGDVEYLKMVAHVIKNQKTNGFEQFMEAGHLTDKVFNKDLIGQLRKDFWKEFLKDEKPNKKIKKDESPLPEE